MWIVKLVTDKILIPTAIALGNFDGIHLGHQRVICPLLELKRTNQSLITTVVSFTPHPKTFFTGETIPLLTPYREKTQYLRQLGIEQFVLLPFNEQLASLSPQAFVEEVLIQKLQAKVISVGQDFCFGYQRRGTVADLKAIAELFGVKVLVSQLKTRLVNSGESVRISSSLIRQALGAGEVSQANQMLGRAYSLRGQVIEGQKLGRTIGFPTANLAIAPDKLLPRNGVYCVRVTLDDAASPVLNGVMNIGYRPTIDGKQLTVEVYLLDWSGELYGRFLQVQLAKFLRPEQKFCSLAALKAQIWADCQSARSFLNLNF